MTFGVYGNGGFHDEDVVGLILASLSVFSMEIPGFCNAPPEMEKRVIDRAVGPKYQSFSLLSCGGQRDFLERFLPLRSTCVLDIRVIKDG